MTVFNSVRAVVELNDRLDQDILEKAKKLYKQLENEEITQKVYDEKLYEYVEGKHTQLHSKINETRKAVNDYGVNEIKAASDALIGNMTADETLEIDSLNNMRDVSEELVKMYAIKYDGNFLALKRLDGVVESHELNRSIAFSDDQLELIDNDYPQAIISKNVDTINDILNGFAVTKNPQDYTNMVASGTNGNGTSIMELNLEHNRKENSGIIMELDREINRNFHESLLNEMEETYYWR